MAQVAPDDTPIICDAEGERMEPCEDPLRRDFEGTLLEAAVDARDGTSWRRPVVVADADEAPADDGGSWSTQCRHLGLAARVLGLARDVSTRAVEAISQVLSVETLRLRDQRSQIKEGGYRRSGQAICAVLERLRRSSKRAFAFLWCGYLTACWGKPLLWDPDHKIFVKSAFLGPGPVSSKAASEGGRDSHELATCSTG